MSKPIDRRNHPCLTCPLPDCDDGSSRCPLRKALSEESTLRKKGLPVSDDLRRRRSIAYYEIYHWPKLERMRLRREGVAT